MMCLPALGHLTGIRGDIQERALDPVPTFDKNPKAWFEAFDDYLTDNYGFKGPLLQSNRVIRDFLGEAPDKVAVGKEDWLFSSNPTYRADFEGRGDWTLDRVNAWIEDLRALHHATTERDIPFAAIIAVDKAQLYPEFTPTNWAGPASRRFRTALYSHPDAASVGLIDIEDDLLGLKENGYSVFYKRDTHWNTNGAYAAYVAAIEALKPDENPSLFTFDGTYVEISPVILRDLETAAGYQVTREPAFLGTPVPPRGEIVQTEVPKITDSAKALRFGSPSTLMSQPDASMEGTLLIFGDSFTNSVRPYLLTAYKNVIHINRRDGMVPLEEILAVIDTYDVDAVLLINSERHAHTMDGPFVIPENAD